MKCRLKGQDKEQKNNMDYDEILKEFIRMDVDPQEISWIIYDYCEIELNGQNKMGYYLFVVGMSYGEYLEIPQENETFELLQEYFKLKEYQGEYPYYVYKKE